MTRLTPPLAARFYLPAGGANPVEIRLIEITGGRGGATEWRFGD